MTFLRRATAITVPGFIKEQARCRSTAPARRPCGFWFLPISAAVAFAAAISACSDNTTTAPGADPASSDDRGAAVYASSCASCHGADLRGTDTGPSQLSVVYEPNHHTDAGYQAAVRNGAQQHHWNFGDMPPVEGLSDEDIDAVITFIRTEQERLGFEPYPPN